MDFLDGAVVIFGSIMPLSDLTRNRIFIQNVIEVEDRSLDG